ncbi:hypothetical protein [Rhizobium sp. NZLR1]|uniref:hypothetical protein n=1 Tax=Rhizobium sp. NZLR1 TaxID=2731096 RepID=UPI001A997121|nr:hypothetical protein [Rhizobium sp. NZLR1]MBX5201024.1 hypothetical protein [Rhizobium sp. NZLR1]QSZ21545.1 hypothetical protein J3O30_02960 [Rhizobium sp. NZLR1]
MGKPLDKKLIETLTTTADAIYAQPKVQRPDDEGFLAEMFAEGGAFNPHKAVTLLLDPQPSYFGHKEAMLAAFSSWVIAPEDEQMQFEFVATSIKNSIKKSEELAQETCEDLSAVEVDMIARYAIAGPQFIENLYFPFTGMHLLAETVVSEASKKDVKAKERRFYTLLRMMDLCHYWSSSGIYASDFGPSVNRAIDVVERFPDRRTVTRSGIYDAWAEVKGNIALIYAANSVEVDEGLSLLESFKQGSIDFDRHYPVFDRWMRRARYVCDTILSKMPDLDLYESNIALLLNIDSEPFPHAEFSGRELDEINNASR